MLETILTTYDTDNDILRRDKGGSKGYLLKDERREVLLESIRKVSRGETCIPPALVEKQAAGMRSESLTGRELEVLSYAGNCRGILKAVGFAETSRIASSPWSWPVSADLRQRLAFSTGVLDVNEKR